jgi:hypothetical protein
LRRARAESSLQSETRLPIEPKLIVVKSQIRQSRLMHGFLTQ